MKYRAKIIVTLKDNIRDVKGDTVSTVLNRIDIEKEANVKIGKYFALEVNAADIDAAYNKLDKIANEVLSNPVIEKYSVLEFKEG